MNKIEIANELLKNTKNIYLKDFIKTYIKNIHNIEQNKCKRKELIRLDNCISYIEKVNFNITDWGLWEIPIFYAHCFYKDKTKQMFDLAVWYIGEVIPRYLDANCNEEDAESIEEAIQKYVIP